MFLCLCVGEETNWGHLTFSRCSSWFLKTEALIYNHMKTTSQSFYLINTWWGDFNCLLIKRMLSEQRGFWVSPRSLAVWNMLMHRTRSTVADLLTCCRLGWFALNRMSTSSSRWRKALRSWRTRAGSTWFTAGQLCCRLPWTSLWITSYKVGGTTPMVPAVFLSTNGVTLLWGATTLVQPKLSKKQTPGPDFTMWLTNTTVATF